MASTPKTKWTVTPRSVRRRRKTPCAIAAGAETTRMPLRMRATPTPTSPPTRAATAAATAVADASAVSGRNGVGTSDASSATTSVRPWSSASTARLQPASGAASAKTIEIATSTSTGPYRWRPYSHSRSGRAEAPPPGWTDMGSSYSLPQTPRAYGRRENGSTEAVRTRELCAGARLRLDHPELRDLAIANPAKDSGEVVKHPSPTPNPDSFRMIDGRSTPYYCCSRLDAIVRATPTRRPLRTTDVPPYLSRTALASAVLWSRLIGGHCARPAAHGCVDEGEPVVRVGAQPYLGARAGGARRHDG